MSNNYHDGILTFISYPVKNGFIVACEELGLLIEEKNLELAKFKLLTQVKLSLGTITEEKLEKNLLNKSLPLEIKKTFLEYVKKSNKQDFERWQQKIEAIQKNKFCLA
jgi:hypothetical protein